MDSTIVLTFCALIGNCYVTINMNFIYILSYLEKLIDRMNGFIYFIVKIIRGWPFETAKEHQVNGISKIQYCCHIVYSRF